MLKPLTFREDDTFVIVQFTDIHWKQGGPEDERSYALMEQVVGAERPDLIVFTGDIIDGKHCADPAQSLRDAVSVAERNRIPWAAVFGNHDDEGKLTRERLLEVLMEHEWHCAGHGGFTRDVSGCGNGVLEVTDRQGNAAAALYFFDSGAYAPVPGVGKYGWIHRDQIAWYESQSRALAARNGGTPLPSLAFFHIPLPEYDEVWQRRVCYGSKHEQVCCPKINTGLFAAMVEMGDVAGTFAGHDHVNDYWGELYGIRLCYGRATGYNTYGREGFPRGARVIRLRRGERDFESWLRLDGGEVVAEQPEHAPEAAESP